MPSKKKKYNARFPAGRIKKIMQSDEEIGKVAQAVPVIISRTLELFVESLLTKTLKITNSRNAKTLSPSHMKQCIMAENRFDFLRELVKNIPDISVAEEAVSNDSSPEATTIDPSDIPYDLSMPSTSNINTEIIIHKQNSTNGVAASGLRNNGFTRNFDTFKSNSSTVNSSGNIDENRTQLKRQWDAISQNVNKVQDVEIATILGKSHESTPPKLLRTDSAPAGTAKAQQYSKTTTITSTTVQQQHEQPNQQLLPTDLRRLRHQPKSVPGNITTHIATESAANQTPSDAIPAPIISIDFCNKPVVKIDYNHPSLHDTNYSESLPSSSSSSPSSTAEHTNRGCIASAVGNLQSTINTTAESPVINIDLSNIVTSGTFTTSSLYPSVICPVTVPTAPPVGSAVTTNKNSFLDLDEDYDNI